MRRGFVDVVNRTCARSFLFTIQSTVPVKPLLLPVQSVVLVYSQEDVTTEADRTQTLTAASDDHWLIFFSFQINMMAQYICRYYHKGSKILQQFIYIL